MIAKIIVILFILVAKCSSYENSIKNSLYEISKRYDSSKVDDYSNPQCYNQIGVYLNKCLTTSLYENNWAWQMFDSSSKLPNGLLTGNLLDYGNFDECLDINTFDTIEIKGKFCMSALRIPTSVLREKDPIKALHKTNITASVNDRLLMMYKPSICIPHHCDAKDIATVIGLPKDTAFNEYCTTKDDIGNYDGADWTFIAFIVIIGIIVITSTYYDMYTRRYKNDVVSEAAIAFSLYTNGCKLFKTSNNLSQITCLNGLRVFGTFWIILFHTGYQNILSLPVFNEFEYKKWTKKYYTEYQQAGHLSVDTFLFISGVVMSYGFVRTQSKPNAHFNLIMFYVHRYLRITPALAVMYLLQITWVRHMSSGPQWEFFMTSEKKLCTENWWTFFLYLQNYRSDKCLSHSWYLSLDIQIYILSPLLLIPLVKCSKYMKYILPGLVVLSVIPPIVTLYYYDAPFNSYEYLHEYLFQTQNRLAPWLVGVILGNYFATNNYTRNTTLKINWIVNLLIWTLVLTGMVTIIYFVHYFTFYYYDRISSAIFIGVFRMFWAIGLSWIVLSCHSGYGGIINSLLSLPLFEVIGKLTYSMYIIHMTVILLRIMRIRTAIVWDDYNLIYNTIGDITVTTFLAIFWTLLFEIPFGILEKIAFGRKVNIRVKPKISNSPDTS